MTTTFTAKRREDLLAAVPVVLGFLPEQSLVMLTFGAGPSFHARVDLPASDDDEAARAEIERLLLAPCRTHEVEQVLLVVYSGDAGLAAWLAAALVPAFVADGIAVIDVLRAHERRWTSVPIRAGARETESQPYDDTTHPFAAQAVFEGRVTRRNREEVRASLAPDPVLQQRWLELLARPDGPRPAGASGRGEPSDDPRKLCALVTGWVTSHRSPDDAGAARVLGSIRRVEVRDALLYTVTQDTARGHVQVWSALLRGAPVEAVPDTAAVTAFCAWLSGNGALAWCALDRCFEVDPDHRLGTCLAECLTRALPPTVWEEVGDAYQQHRDSA